MNESTFLFLGTMNFRPISKQQRLLVIGLDSAPPELVFDRLAHLMPNLNRLRRRGVYGRLVSSDPPITVPAWASMFTGLDAGQLGIYGFRNRTRYDYSGLTLCTAEVINAPFVWNYLSDTQKRSTVIGVPLTYPVRPFHGQMIAGLLAPGLNEKSVHPTSLLKNLIRRYPDYAFDISDFRTLSLKEVWQAILRMTESRFQLAAELLAQPSWDLFVLVEIGLDRVHHVFWKFWDREHRLHEPHSQFAHAIPDYYRLLDRNIGDLLQIAGADTAVLVVSDHGAQRMDGGICLNDWLVRNGYLALQQLPAAPVSLSECQVDWQRTRIWAEGGYYGRLFFNIRGREPNGIVEPGEVNALFQQVKRELECIPDDMGRPLTTQVLRPHELYHDRNGIPPDALVYFDELRWRCIGTVGNPRLHRLENDRGPDGANHSREGLFIWFHPHQAADGRNLLSHSILDIAPTILHFFGYPIPKIMYGSVLNSFF